MTPSNVKATKVDFMKAKAVLTDTGNYIVRYLRSEPTVTLARLPVRDEHGSVLVDIDPVRKRVICAGIPFGCMVAFMYDSKLMIGWSKRMETRELIETPELHSLFKEATVVNVFDSFCAKLLDFLNGQETREIEKAFSKKDGKIAAIIRGINDTIAFTPKGSLVNSGASGPIPQEVAKNLRWFISQAEQAYGGKAANVSYPNQDIVAATGTLPAV